MSIPRTRRDSGLLLSLPFRLPGWSWLPAHLAWEGTSPAPVLHALAAWVCMQPACREGLEPKGITLFIRPTCFIPSSPQLSVPAAYSPVHWWLRSSAQKAWHPASDLSWPPHPGSVEGREYGPHPELALLILFHRVWNVQAGRALGIRPAQPLVHRQETGPQGLPPLPSLAPPWADPGLELKAPEAHRAPSSSHLRWS